MAVLCKDTVGHQDVGSVYNRREKEKDTISAQLSKAMFNAAKTGNTNILELILKHYPNFIFEVNSCKQSLLHIAILHRQRSVYKLILKNEVAKNVLTKLVDSKGNNVLHLAGEMKQAKNQSRLSTHYVLMSSEDKWFQVRIYTRLFVTIMFFLFTYSLFYTFLNAFIILFYNYFATYLFFLSSSLN